MFNVFCIDFENVNKNIFLFVFIVFVMKLREEKKLYFLDEKLFKRFLGVFFNSLLLILGVNSKFDVFEFVNVYVEEVVRMVFGFLFCK